MSQVTNTNVASASEQSFGSANTLNDVGLDDFLNLMIAELQNQDPLNPLENDQLIAQISQIREVGATEKLTETLDSVLLGQSISSATNLIGAQIEAISDDDQRVTGKVDRVSIEDGHPKLHLDVNPGVDVSDESGDLQAGDYNYRVVWRDEDGNLFGIETTEALTLANNGQSFQINNLPETSTPKQVYRTKVGGEEPYHLVAVIPDGATSSYHDTTSDENLSPSILSETPQFIAEPTRSFTVSLNNVGEIRPPGS